MLLVWQLGNSALSDLTARHISYNFEVLATESLKNWKKNGDWLRTVHNPQLLVQNKWLVAAKNGSGPPKSPFHPLQSTVRRQNIWNNSKHKNTEKEISRPSLPRGLTGKGEDLST
jgi:hypothetical protein